MVGYVGRRLLRSLGVLLGVSVIVFGLLHLTGDPTRLLLPLEAREEDVRQLRALLGLDDPLWAQYGRFLARARNRPYCAHSGSSRPSSARSCRTSSSRASSGRSSRVGSPVRCSSPKTITDTPSRTPRLRNSRRPT